MRNRSAVTTILVVLTVAAPAGKPRRFIESLAGLSCPCGWIFSEYIDFSPDPIGVSKPADVRRD